MDRIEPTTSTDNSKVKESPKPAAVPPTKTPPTAATFTRQNTVTTVNLAGVDIVALRIDAKERLCLAQISTTLLKRYSYNEIHNRRVALGITCVQCTPVQLEILRRAGAMPISSRRCGMITKREAERLVKSFLEENLPPKLPENFSFEVEHKCGWGCRGLFVPSRYNSSRAKCIKCTYCNMYFSPNKFIFHYHRMPDSKYTHPDAANFNSWRRHITLVGEPADELSHAWEDVKAMFNGGSRKRILCSITSKFESRMTNDSVKKPKIVTAKCQNSDILTHHYNYPIYHPVKSPYPISPIPAHSAYVGYPYGNNKPTFNANESKSNYLPLNGMEPQFTGSYDFFWQNLGQKAAALPVGTIPSPKFAFEAENELNRNNVDNSSIAIERFYSPRSEPEKLSPIQNRSSYMSAFTPVGRHLVTSSSPSIVQSPKSEHSHGKPERDEKDAESDADVDNIVIDVINDTNTDVDALSDQSDDRQPSRTEIAPEEPHVIIEEAETDEFNETVENKDLTNKKQTKSEENKEEENDLEKSTPENDCSEQESGANLNTQLASLSKDLLVSLLEKELQKSKEFDREYSALKETLQQQVKRELAYRDQLAKQLQLVKENLYQELEQERKTRYTLQQKLKEAHDALHRFSCKMLTSRHCTECVYKTTQLQKEISAQLQPYTAIMKQ